VTILYQAETPQVDRRMSREQTSKRSASLLGPPRFESEAHDARSSMHCVDYAYCTTLDDARYLILVLLESHLGSVLPAKNVHPPRS
jgi:hypothetical protein